MLCHMVHNNIHNVMEASRDRRYVVKKLLAKGVHFDKASHYYIVNSSIINNNFDKLAIVHT